MQPLRAERSMSGTDQAKERLGFLDVARGVAALLVLLEHGLGVQCPAYRAWSAGSFSLGRCGVVLFLVVSGFIIPKSLEQTGSQAIFWLRRFFRLFPAYWLSIAAAFLLVCLGVPRVRVPIEQSADWLLNLTMFQGFFSRPHVWGVFWTLQLELVIYAVCSLLLAVRMLRRAGWIIGLVIVGYAALGIGRPLVEGKPFTVGGPRLLYWAPMMGLVAQRCLTGEVRIAGLWAVVLGQAAAVAAVWGVNHALYPEVVTGGGLTELACTWGCVYSVFLLLMAGRNRALPVFARWLGRISYSAYLLHPLVLMMTAGVTQAWLFWPVFLLGTLLLAELSYRLVEAPGIALGRALEKRWLRAPAPSQTVASPELRQAA
jgi:peptidoglycan/LPS O-acetylase OafA/YrhL